MGGLLTHLVASLSFGLVERLVSSTAEGFIAVAGLPGGYSDAGRAAANLAEAMTTNGG